MVGYNELRWKVEALCGLEKIEQQIIQTARFYMNNNLFHMIEHCY